MACKTSTQLHHHFPKIADEAGFTFNTHRPRIRIDWNKIRVIDVENLIRERKFNLIEQHLNDILDCILESEFDVRILDEGVLKMFRLAQLTVEYQQFCRHYLDRSVYVLREEINSLAQELDVTKKELKDRDEEIRKLKRKTKHTYRTPLPYGNENIANMILKTLSNKSEFFPTSTTGDAIQYNKCVYCDKVFMNQLYLKGHISRRHSNIMDTPQKDVDENVKVAPNNTENNKLSEEVLELKQKLKEMEDNFKNVNVPKQESPNKINHNNNININKEQPTNISVTTETKDAEVCTNNEIDLLERIEEWKKEENDKYKREINLLRSQIMETIQSLKEKDSSTSPSSDKDVKIIEHLNITINKQGSEILTLKQELFDSKLKIEKEESERRKENETQMLQWANRAEDHAKHYETLLQKLNEVAREARESSALAERERERVAQLEAILQKNLNERNAHDTVDSDTKNLSGSNQKEVVKQTPIKRKSFEKPAPDTSRETLERLHKKAQALLNIRSSSSSSDVSSVENPKPQQLKPGLKKQQSIKVKNHTNKEVKKEENNVVANRKKEKVPNHVQQSNKNIIPKQNTKEQPNKKDKSVKKSNQIEKNGPILTPGSPLKLLRAKITEEVNNRLISNGVDPLKNVLPKANYQKQRNQLQQQVELKSKKNPTHEKVRYSILAYLESSLPKKATIPQQEYVSPSKTYKAFSLTSVISNVKSKALSLVKLNDTTVKDNRKLLNAEVAKRALKLLNTPPDSTHSSPASQKHHAIEAQPKLNLNLEPKRSRPLPKRAPELTISNKSKRQMIKSSPHTTDDSDDDSESDHKYYKANVQETTKSIDNLIKSPARRPLSANNDYNNIVRKYVAKDDHLLRSQSATNITHVKPDTVINSNVSKDTNKDSSDTESSEHILIEDVPAKGNLNSPKQTKGVLKNASSTSSLNKKKVIFDMDAIQMKSLSASPSQSITEKSDGNEKHELGLINLDGEEWDISSIENEPLKNDTKLKVNTRTSPKIAELKNTIESQLARRNETPSTAIVGGVDILAGPMLRASSVGGSNTSLGSSILDDSETMPPVVNHNSFVKPKAIAHKDDSELDLSEFSTDGLFTRKKENDSF